jgi:two-component system, LytTR family, sensor histidine kinase AlgZ
MHPLWKDKRGLVLYLLSWAGLGVLFSVSAASGGALGWGEAHGVVVLPTVLFGFMCLSTWYLCSAFPVDRTPPARLLAAFLTASAATSILWVGTLAGWSTLLEALGAGQDLTARVKEGAVQWFAVGNVLFLLAAAVHYLLIAVQRAGETERKALQLGLLARDAELKALRLQVDPHFLFNSLNSISALTTSDPPSARAMVMRLAGFLRAALDAGRRDQFTLKEELDLARDYLEIERIRFGDRLAVEVRTDPEALGCAVPPLLMQPLVENAVKHGIAHLLEGGTVHIEAVRSGGRVSVRVVNPAERDRPRGKGLGLANVRQRLEVLYGRESAMTVDERDGLFAAEVVFPAQEVSRP